MLFDIGIAGPIAGFLVAVPALVHRLWRCRTSCRMPAELRTASSLGEPLLFQLASWLLWGTPPDGYSLNMHPMAFAAWFGLLATALNLFPIGQLDGGHISYAVLGRRSSLRHARDGRRRRSRSTFFSSSWIVWTVLMIVMLVMFGPHHPRTFDEHVPLDRDAPASWRSFARRHVRPLLHAGADHAERSHWTVRLQICDCRSAIQSAINLKSAVSICNFRALTADRRRRSCAAASSGATASAACERFAHPPAVRALDQQLRAVLAAQLAERRRRRPEHAQRAGVAPPAACCTTSAASSIAPANVRDADDRVDERRRSGG